MIRIAAVATLALVTLVGGCSDRPSAAPSGTDGVLFDARPATDTGVFVADTAVADTNGGDEVSVVDGYPAGPYGLRTGAIFPPLALFGYEGGSLAWTKIALRDSFDPDGSKGVRGILVIVAAQWCGVCQQEARWVPNAYTAKYQARGARFLTAMIHDRNYQPATRLVADQWREAFAIPFAIVIDPEQTTVPKEAGTLALPYTYVIDPRTMRIEKVMQAAQPPPSFPELDAVLARNGG